MVPLRTRAALGGMGVGGTLPDAFFRSEPARLEMLGVRWVQVPATSLAAPDASGSRASPWTCAWTRDGAVSSPFPWRPPPRSASSRCSPTPSASPRDRRSRVSRRAWPPAASFELSLRAGVDTAEWAWERADVRPRVAHQLAPVFESWTDPGTSFAAHRYLGRLRLPGRYVVDGVSLEARPDTGRLMLSRLAVFDALTGAAHSGLARRPPS